MEMLKSKHTKLTSDWKKKDLKSCQVTLDELKVLMSAQLMTFLPTNSDLNDSDKQDLILARGVLEIGAQHAIAVKNVDAFERFMSQLKTYYVDYEQLLPESAYRFELLGLNLLSLLSKNKIADFHTELEQLPSDSLRNNPYIRCPVTLEQFIMEGSYNKVLMLKDNLPAESYAFFVDKLLDTIRDEIASCMEKAYDSITVKECAKMLQLDTRTTNKYISEKGWNVVSVGKEQKIKFEHEGEDKMNEEVPTEELAKMAITYAREMEQIV